MEHPDDVTIQRFQREMLNYWKEHGRKDLPWRQTRDPWKLLLTEIMLRKTTSGQVVEMYDIVSRWSPEDILAIEVDHLKEYLAPLGLSEVRSIQLKELAEGWIKADGDEIQTDEFLRSFKGIGRYISNSVRCCAFGEPLPALDTNMIRIIQRVFSWVSTRKRPRDDTKLWAFAEQFVPTDGSREFNWAVLDFGATICTHYKPKCSICPLTDICDYYKEITKN